MSDRKLRRSLYWYPWAIDWPCPLKQTRLTAELALNFSRLKLEK
ncbi:hypothetical protein RSSM_02408 [Rhodopirellula sallentina SM41]|uniref:Uncharacterized protein n=1 Tax=Rhodopirellula sallentina SM41 TaxID=1263870 RepID=M5U4G3_9BACT|nr:hypothetical protein RSSM_02408 [Rhodopirellula sallentina SM41]